MTDFRDRPDATDRWRATIEALEAVVLAAPDEPEIEPTEAEEVRRLVMVQIARRTRNTLPAAWVRRPEIVSQVVPDAEPTLKATEHGEPTPRAPDRPAPRPPACHR
jgi:hypothetical protein